MKIAVDSDQKVRFRVSAPTVCNALSSAVRLSDSVVGFKCRLETSLFNCAFSCDINSDFVSSSQPSDQAPLNLVIELWRYTSLIYYYYV